jgi:hypothetical protein
MAESKQLQDWLQSESVGIDMKLKRWLGQSTTGAGVAVLLAIIASFAVGNLTWDHALPLLAAAIVGLIWPENSALQAAAGNTAASVESLLAAYRAGLSETHAPKPAVQAGFPANESGRRPG